MDQSQTLTCLPKCIPMGPAFDKVPQMKVVLIELWYGFPKDICV